MRCPSVCVLKPRDVFKQFSGSRCHFELYMANLDLYTTIRLDPDLNGMGHNSRGSFDPMRHACFRAIAYFQRIWSPFLATTHGRFTAVTTGSQVDKSYLNFHPACRLINHRSAVALHCCKAHSEIYRKMENLAPCKIVTSENFTLTWNFAHVITARTSLTTQFLV